LNFTKYV